MRPRLGFSLGVAALFAAVLPSPARASLVVALDTPAMVQRADHIAVVDVASVSAAWDDKHERIFTTIELDVVEVWKGPMTPATRVKIMQPGGTVGDIQMKVFGLSSFTRGERALVFLRGTPESSNVVGMAQGKRLLTREAVTGRWMVRAPDKAGASFIRTTPSSVNAPVFETAARPLDDVRAEVRALVLKAQVK
ncbi:MAG TPA: hypothetical protein VHJ20_23830 [Polyangia bacterium]|nr:hypothetical protein [Polyangia bacterium]